MTHLIYKRNIAATLTGAAIAVSLALGFTTQVFAHEEDSRVSIEADLTKANAGKFQYQFQLVDTKEKKIVTDSDLNITHEKKLHMIIYDPSLNEFHHVHPEFNNEMWSVDLSILVNGKYWVWAQGDLAADGEEFSASARLDIVNGTAAWATPPVLKDLREGVSGISKVTIDNKKLTAGKMVMLNMKMSRTDGSVAQITPYLGAFAHIVAVPDDADSLIHVHPMDGGKPDVGMIHVTFPRKGFYRMWIQFIDNQELKVIPLSVQVN